MKKNTIITLLMVVSVLLIVLLTPKKTVLESFSGKKKCTKGSVTGLLNNLKSGGGFGTFMNVSKKEYSTKRNLKSFRDVNNVYSELSYTCPN